MTLQVSLTLSASTTDESLTLLKDVSAALTSGEYLGAAKRQETPLGKTIDVLPKGAKAKLAEVDDFSEDAGQDAEADFEAEPEAPKRSRGRPPKTSAAPMVAPKVKKAPVIDDYESESADESECDDEAEAEDTAELDIDGDILPALHTYSKKYGRDAAAGVLAKFKIKGIRDLPESKFAAFLVELSKTPRKGK